MIPALPLFFVLFLYSPAAAQDLPPDMLADQYLLEATKAMRDGNRQKAERAFKKIEALDVEPPPMFAYFYGKLLAEHGMEPEVLRKGQSLLKQFVISAGRESEYYTPTLELLSMVETKVEVVERQAPLFRKVNAQMVRIEGGFFTMGCTPEQENCRDPEKPAHQVQVRSFELSKYEVTQELWEAVMGENPSFHKHKNCPQCPVDNVSWYDVQAFLRTLNAGLGQYRLPSEAEWEYAARGGQRGRGYQYAGSNTPGEVAWYEENSGKKAHPVGQKQANELGLYDLSGNVWEWVQDCWNMSYTGAPSDGWAWEQGDCRHRVARGGDCFNDQQVLRSADRFRIAVGERPPFMVGFRIARSLP